MAAPVVVGATSASATLATGDALTIPFPAGIQDGDVFAAFLSMKRMKAGLFYYYSAFVLDSDDTYGIGGGPGLGGYVARYVEGMPAFAARRVSGRTGGPLEYLDEFDEPILTAGVLVAFRNVGDFQLSTGSWYPSDEAEANDEPATTEFHSVALGLTPTFDGAYYPVLANAVRGALVYDGGGAPYQVPGFVSDLVDGDISDSTPLPAVGFTPASGPATRVAELEGPLPIVVDLATTASDTAFGVALTADVTGYGVWEQPLALLLGVGVCPELAAATGTPLAQRQGRPVAQTVGRPSVRVLQVANVSAQASEWSRCRTNRDI